MTLYVRTEVATVGREQAQVASAAHRRAEVVSAQRVGLRASLTSTRLRMTVSEAITFINRPFVVVLTVNNQTFEPLYNLQFDLDPEDGLTVFEGDFVMPFVAPMSSATIHGKLVCSEKGAKQITFTAGDLSASRSVHILHLDGIFWQTLNANVGYRRSWDKLGVTDTAFQWVAVGDSPANIASFLEEDLVLVPTKQIKLLDIGDIAEYPWAENIVVGLAGFWGEVASRTNTALMVSMANEIAGLGWPTNVTGFYFPLEIDPTWEEAPEVMGPVLAALPRPLYVSAYYGNGVDTAEAAEWLASFIPSDVTLMFQDGVGAFDVPIEQAVVRIQQLIAAFPPGKVEIILEAFRINPDFTGVDGTYFIPATANQILAQVAAFSGLGKIWAFDGPSYLTSNVIQEMLDMVPVETPVDLRVTRSLTGKSAFRWTRVESGATVVGYRVNVYDFSGNNVLRRYTVPFEPGLVGQYSKVYEPADIAVDFPGLDVNFFVFTVQEMGLNDFYSEESAQFAGYPVVDNSDLERVVVFAGQSNAVGHFSSLSNVGGVLSSTVFAQSLETQLGFGPNKVGLINAALGSSAVDKRAAELLPDGTRGTNYWWDLDGNAPGPRVASLLEAVTAAGVTPSALVWAQGESDCTASDPAFHTPNGLGNFIYSDVGRFKAATTALFAHLRTALGLPSLPIWVQTLGRSYWGGLVDPQEPLATTYKAYRTAQVEIAVADANTKIGSWVSSAGSYTGYLAEATGFTDVYGYIHYKPFVYHEVAVELATSIGTNLDRVASPPDWATLNAVTGLTAVRNAGNDITVSWNAAPPAAGYAWLLRDVSVGTAPVLRSGTASGLSFAYTAAQQVEDYGFSGVTIIAEVFPLTAGGIKGPPAGYTGIPPLAP